MWKYNNEEMTCLEDFPQGTYGFVYRVIHKPSKIAYIGKKVLFHNIKSGRTIVINQI
jgi:hypothetical protein